MPTVAYGHKQAWVGRMWPKNGVLIRRHAIVARPPPLQLHVAAGEQVVPQHGDNMGGKRLRVPVEIEAWGFVADGARNLQVIVGLSVVAKRDIALAVEHHRQFGSVSIELMDLVQPSRFTQESEGDQLN